MQFHRINPLLVSVLPILVASECFYPDGKNATGLFPCYPDADVSHCCRKSDVCLSNGLCFSSGLGTIVRRGCTEPSWKSDSCPAVCDIGMQRRVRDTPRPCPANTTQRVSVLVMPLLRLAASTTASAAARTRPHAIAVTSAIPRWQPRYPVESQCAKAPMARMNLLPLHPL
jgi:hypothetical protein